MENIKSAAFYAEKIASESRHKFIYSYKNNRELLIQQIRELYPIRIGNEPCALYFEITDLSIIDTDLLTKNKDAIAIICNEHLSFSIASEIIRSIIQNNDLSDLRKVEMVLLDYVNFSLTKKNIDSIQALLSLLEETKSIFFETYCDYIKKGVLTSPFEKIPIHFTQPNYFINCVKQMLERAKHISIVLDHKNEVYLGTYKAINNLVSCRINGNLSMNILTEPDDWKSYYAQNGQIIEATHDYESVHYDESGPRYTKKQMRDSFF